MTHDRLIAFDRVLNFRDFGGWDTMDGAKVTRGKLFRSAAFSEATEADIARLDAMEMDFLVDLRRPEERRYEPNKWPGESVPVFVNDEGAEGVALPPHLVALMQGDLTAASTRAYMMSLYQEIPFDPRLISLYRDWFGQLAEGKTGVIHCAAGKDRTGIACALTLIALGVDDETVFADYEFTNAAVDLEKRMLKIQARMEERLSRKLDPEALRPMLGVEVGYLRNALDAIEAKYGSALNYMERELGVGAHEREALKRKLVE